MSSGTSSEYDAIVIGARCAGAPTAMLLARQGHRVLVVDRGVVPERHSLDARDPRTGNRRAEPLGAARPGDSHRLPPDRGLFVRLRADHDRRDASPSRRHLDGVRTAAHRPRQDPRRCRF